MCSVFYPSSNDVWWDTVILCPSWYDQTTSLKKWSNYDLRDVAFSLKQWFFMEVVLPPRGPYGNLWNFFECQNDGGGEERVQNCYLLGVRDVKYPPVPGTVVKYKELSQSHSTFDLSWNCF